MGTIESNEASKHYGREEGRMKEYIVGIENEHSHALDVCYKEELIRCKDCKWHIEAHYEAEGEPPYIKHLCKWLHGYQFQLDHYCGMAERKTYDQTVVTNEQEMILLCKYCKYWSPFGDGSVGYCHLNNEAYVEKCDGYCSHAKRRKK